MQFNQMTGNKIKQVARYGIVGVAVNITGYLVYLLLTWLWLDPKTAISLTYPVGATIGYFGNSHYVFSYNGSKISGVLRYVIAHVIGYLANFSLLYIFVDRFFFPHQLIQGIAIIVVGGILFLLFKYFVFSKRSLHIS